jgi:putative RNA 2'-phosphotransferase
VVLKIHSGEMSRDGHKFHLSENGVWLTKEIQGKYIEKL